MFQLGELCYQQLLAGVLNVFGAVNVGRKFSGLDERMLFEVYRYVRIDSIMKIASLIYKTNT